MISFLPGSGGKMCDGVVAIPIVEFFGSVFIKIIKCLLDTLSPPGKMKQAFFIDVFCSSDKNIEIVYIIWGNS